MKVLLWAHQHHVNCWGSFSAASFCRPAAPACVLTLQCSARSRNHDSLLFQGPPLRNAALDADAHSPLSHC